MSRSVSETKHILLSFLKLTHIFCILSALQYLAASGISRIGIVDHDQGLFFTYLGAHTILEEISEYFITL